MSLRRIIIWEYFKLIGETAIFLFLKFSELTAIMKLYFKFIESDMLVSSGTALFNGYNNFLIYV